MPATELQRKIISFVVFAAIYVGALVLLSAFDAVILTSLSESFPNPLVISVAENLIRIFKVILGMAIVITVVRFVVYLLQKAVYRRSTESEISSLLRTVLSVIVYIVSFFIIFQTVFPGIELTALFTGSTIVGIVVGLALQDTLGNLFAGLALQADQPFQIGDVVLIAGRGEGVVEAVSWRGIKIRTFQNKLLVISNSVLGKEFIEVAPKDNLNAKVVFFNSLYTHSPARTIQVIRDAVRQIDNVSNKIRPVVRIRNLAADGIDWEVKYWLEDYTIQHDTDALIRQRIWYVFARENIHFAYPTRTLYMEEKPVEVAPEEVINTFADRLNRVSIFAPLSDEEIEQLANASTSRVYAPGEAIVRQGQSGGSMFVITRGSVKVQIPEQGYQKTVNTLHENEFFGEMSLLTGEPRSANVIAVDETEVVRIDKAGLKPILEGNPTLVESLGELMEERRVLLRSAQTAAEEDEKDPTKKGVMRSIKRFFGLR